AVKYRIIKDSGINRAVSINLQSFSSLTQLNNILLIFEFKASSRPFTTNLVCGVSYNKKKPIACVTPSEFVIIMVYKLTGGIHSL
ncbi:MAG: hypothetical protein ACYS6K_07315, partial [Planctomycetota bacterium]